jgi:L-asparagine oxygenase
VFNRNFTKRLLAETPSPYCSDIRDYLSHVLLLNQEFSQETRNILQQLKEGRIKYCQFVNIPVTEEIPPTATIYHSIIPKKTFQSEGVIGAVSLELGRLFNYRETSEFLMYDIYPAKGYEDSRSFVNSRKMLSFHSDGSAHPELSPDYVLLYCIRSDHGAVNLVVDLDALVERLSIRAVDVLSQPLFNHLVSESPEHYELKPVLYRAGKCFTVKYDEDNTFGINAEAKFFQERLNEVLREVATAITNTSNSLLVIDNKRCLHARTSFNPKYDGQDRWIKCAFVTNENIESGSIVSLSL